MAAPSLNWNRTYVMGQAGASPYEAPILPVTTTIIPSTTSTYSVTSEGSGIQIAPTIAGAYGGRTVFTASRDLSINTFFGFQLVQYGWPFPNLAAFVDTFSNGGISIVVFDSSGNWSEFNVYGSEYTNTALESGGWGAFRTVGNTGANQIVIDRARTPNASSGVLNWALVDGFELIIRIVNTTGSTPSIEIGSLITFDQPELINGEVADAAGFDTLSAEIRNPNFNYQMADVFKDTGGNFSGGIGEIYEPRYSFSIGDGVTPTYFRDTGGTLTPYPIAGSGNETLPSLLMSASDRTLTINQSATDDAFFDGTISAATDALIGNQDNIIVIGDPSGSCVFSAVPFYNKKYMSMGHSSTPNGSFTNCEQVEIEIGTVITDAPFSASSATSKGIYTQDVAGTYVQSITFRANNLGDDITIDPPVSGTYDFPNISVEAGHTIKLRNDSAVNALTIGIPTGMPFSTSTAGGTITVSTPPVSVTYAAPNLLDDTRVRLYNVTQATEIENIVVAGGSGYSKILTLGVDYNTNDEVTLLATYQQLGVAKRVFRASTLLTTSDVTTVDSQVNWDDAGPNTLGIDGATVTECATDYIEIQVEVDDADNTTQKARIAAFIVDAITTEAGIRNWVALDGTPVIQYSTNTAARIDANVATVEVINVKPASLLEVKDSFEFDWSDGIDRVGAILGSSINWLAPARVLPLETGVSGLTPTESVKLFSTAEEATAQLILVDTAQILADQAISHAELLTKSSQISVDSLQTSVDAVPSAIENADGLLARSNQGGKDTGISVGESLMAIGRNKWDLNPTTGLMQVYEDDESTIAFSIQTGLAPRDPVNSGDPV